MLKDLVTVANSLDSLGLFKEADLLDSVVKKYSMHFDGGRISKLASESEESIFPNTRAFFRDLAIRVAAIIKSEKIRMDRFGRSNISIDQFNGIYQMCQDLANECESGNLVNLPNIFKMKFSTTKDPNYPDDFLLNHNGLGYAMGKDIVRSSLTPEGAPIQDYTKAYSDGETEGIIESIKNIISAQKSEFDKVNNLKTRAIADMESRLLGDLEEYKNLMEKKMDRKDKANWDFSYKNRRFNDDDYGGEMTFTGVSEEEAKSNIEGKRKQIEEDIKQYIEKINPIKSDFKSSLTPAQMKWVKLLKI
jgi:hypothetical protein